MRKKLINQSKSIHQMVREGTDWSGEKIGNNLIEGSLVLETMIKGLGGDYYGINGWSDFQPSYVILKKRTKPEKVQSGTLENGKVVGVLGNMWEWYSVLEVFVRDKDKYGIRDYRVLSPYQGGFLY